jgi:hypothetical protein
MRGLYDSLRTIYNRRDCTVRRKLLQTATTSPKKKFLIYNLKVFKGLDFKEGDKV